MSLCKECLFLLYNSMVSFSFSWTFVRISLFIHFAFDFFFCFSDCFLLKIALTYIKYS